MSGSPMVHRSMRWLSVFPPLLQTFRYLATRAPNIRDHRLVLLVPRWYLLSG